MTALGTATPIGEVACRQRVLVHGHIRSLRVRPWGDHPTLEVVVTDDTGGITAVFLARRRLGGVRLGAEIILEGVAGAHQGRLAILNPAYELLS